MLNRIVHLLVGEDRPSSPNRVQNSRSSTKLVEHSFPWLLAAFPNIHICGCKYAKRARRGRDSHIYKRVGAKSAGRGGIFRAAWRGVPGRGRARSPRASALHSIY